MARYCRYLLLLSPALLGAVAFAKDGGYRFDGATKSCVNPTTHQAGYNQKEMMECGDLRTIDFKDLLSYFAPEAQKHPDLLAGKTLTGANASGLDLHGFSFIGATLDNADFSNANLKGAVLRSAEVTATTLTGATFDETTVLPDGWTRETATQRGMVFAGAASANSVLKQNDGGRDQVKVVPDAHADEAASEPAAIGKEAQDKAAH